jgi:hypothetical protein
MRNWLFLTVLLVLLVWLLDAVVIVRLRERLERRKFWDRIAGKETLELLVFDDDYMRPITFKAPPS